jgi:hypothetical protein
MLSCLAIADCLRPLRARFRTSWAFPTVHKLRILTKRLLPENPGLLRERCTRRRGREKIREAMPRGFRFHITILRESVPLSPTRLQRVDRPQWGDSRQS